jgi:uncharacterized protein (TIRG00374 family)
VDKKKHNKTVKIPIIVSIALSIAVILIVLKITIKPDELLVLFQQDVRYEFFVIAIMLRFAVWFLWGARLQILSNAIDKEVHISLLTSTKIVITNLFLAGITPSMAGGEPVRIHLLTKEGMSIGKATAATLGERLIDAIFILIGVPLAFFVFKDIISSDVLKIALSIGVGVFLIVIILFVYAIKNPGRTKSFLIFISNKLSRFSKNRGKQQNKKIITKINREVDNFHESMVFFISEGKTTLFKAGFITVLLWSAGFFIASMILLGLGSEPFFIESYAAQLLLLVIIMMPTTPGSTGVTELSIAGLYSALIGPSILGIFVLLFRFLTYHINLIAGAIFQYKIFKSVASFSTDVIKSKK